MDTVESNPIHTQVLLSLPSSLNTINLFPKQPYPPPTRETRQPADINLPTTDNRQPPTIHAQDNQPVAISRSEEQGTASPRGLASVRSRNGDHQSLSKQSGRQPTRQGKPNPRPSTKVPNTHGLPPTSNPLHSVTSLACLILDRQKEHQGEPFRSYRCDGNGTGLAEK